MHVLELSAAVVVEYVPAPQLVRTVSPVDAQYVPGGHKMQVEATSAAAVDE